MNTIILILFIIIIYGNIYSQKEPIGIGTKGESGLPILDIPNQTPPCRISDNCNPENGFMPVWRWDNATSQLNECPSPLYIRKDVFTCQKIVREFGTSSQEYGGTDYNSNCPKCNIGFVGINAMIPEEQLHVNGNIKCQYGRVMGDIATNSIFSNKVKNDPDNIPNSGDEEYEPIVFKNDAVFNHINASDASFSNVNVNSFTSNVGSFNALYVNNNVQTTTLNANNINSANASISNLKVTNSLTSPSITTNSLTNNGDMTVKGVFRIKNSTNTNVFAVYQDGKIRAREFKSDLLPIPDYVFKKGYKLMPLSDLENYIEKENHLPNIKSEEEYKKEGGIDLGELNIKLLEKVEELTLHLIEQNKKIEKLEKLITSSNK